MALFCSKHFHPLASSQETGISKRGNLYYRESITKVSTGGRPLPPFGLRNEREDGVTWNLPSEPLVTAVGTERPEPAFPVAIATNAAALWERLAGFSS